MNRIKELSKRLVKKEPRFTAKARERLEEAREKLSFASGNKEANILVFGSVAISPEFNYGERAHNDIDVTVLAKDLKTLNEIADKLEENSIIKARTPTKAADTTLDFFEKPVNFKHLKKLLWKIRGEEHTKKEFEEAVDLSTRLFTSRLLFEGNAEGLFQELKKEALGLTENHEAFEKHLFKELSEIAKKYSIPVRGL